jgi:4-hydroxybenzoate polyprenyltransferase
MVEKIGIKKRYPHLEKRFGKLTAYFQLIRPFTLMAPLLAGFFGVLSIVTDFYLAIYVGLTLAACQAVGQIINQYCDIELDKIIKPYRPLPAGVLTKEEALGAAWLLAIAAIARAFTVNIQFGLGIITLFFIAFPPLVHEESTLFSIWFGWLFLEDLFPFF